MSEPTTAAGRALLANLDYIDRHSQDTSFPTALDDILAIEAEATDDEALREAAHGVVQADDDDPMPSYWLIHTRIAALRDALLGEV